MSLSREQRDLIQHAKDEGYSPAEARKYLKGAVPLKIIEREFPLVPVVGSVVTTDEPVVALPEKPAVVEVFADDAASAVVVLGTALGYREYVAVDGPLHTFEPKVLVVETSNGHAAGHAPAVQPDRPIVATTAPPTVSAAVTRQLNRRKDAVGGQWSDPEVVDMLRKLWADGLSASQVAAQLGPGFTRNAVIGKVDRLGLPERAKTSWRPRVARVAASPRSPQIGKKRGRPRGNGKGGNALVACNGSGTTQRGMVTVDTFFDPPARADGHGTWYKQRPWSAAQRGVERSPLSYCAYTDDADFACTSPTAFGTSWCMYHYCLVYAPSTWCIEAKRAFASGAVKAAKPVMVEPTKASQDDDDDAMDAGFVASEAYM